MRLREVRQLVYRILQEMEEEKAHHLVSKVLSGDTTAFAELLSDMEENYAHGDIEGKLTFLSMISPELVGVKSRSKGRSIGEDFVITVGGHRLVISIANNDAYVRFPNGTEAHVVLDNSKDMDAPEDVTGEKRVAYIAGPTTGGIRQNLPFDVKGRRSWIPDDFYEKFGNYPFNTIVVQANGLMIATDTNYTSPIDKEVPNRIEVIKNVLKLLEPVQSIVDMLLTGIGER